MSAERPDLEADEGTVEPRMVPSYRGIIGATACIREDGRPVVAVRMGNQVDVMFAEGAERFADVILAAVTKARKLAERLEVAVRP